MIYLIGKLEEGVKNHVCEVSDVLEAIGKEPQFLNYEITYRAAREISLMKNDLRRQYNLPSSALLSSDVDNYTTLQGAVKFPVAPVTGGTFPNVIRSDPFRLSNKIWEHQVNML